jgi:hypothetical protein
LGQSTKSWPACGEIDIVEAGSQAAINAGKQNNRIGGALHWYEESTSNGGDWAATYDLATNLYDDYHTFTLVWSPTVIQMFLDGNTSPYYSMPINGTNKEEFRDYPNFILFNLAVGGMFPSIYNVAGITAPVPASMYIDYVRVYQKTGEGELITNPAAETGEFPVFVETGSYNNSFVLGYDASVNTTGVTINNTETPYEGSQVLSYSVADGDSFKVDIISVINRNMANYVNGSLKFYLKTTCSTDIEIGISDANGNESWVTLNNDVTYNPSRDNKWSKVIIPFSDFNGTTNFAKVIGMIKIKGLASGTDSISIDKVIWSETVPATDYYGLYTDNPNITERFIINNVSGHIYIWDNTMTGVTGATPYEGEGILSFKSIGSLGWYGYGFFSNNPVDLSAFKTGYLNLAIRTKATGNFKIEVSGANSTKGGVEFTSNSYGLIRDGKWHIVSIPMATLVGQGLDLSACKDLLMFSGAPTIIQIDFDDIYFAADALKPANPGIIVDPPSEITDNDLSDNIVCYPNPTTDKLYISGVEANTTIEIYDISSKLILKQVAESANMFVEMSGLPKGIYVLKVNNKQQLYMKKVVRN